MTTATSQSEPLIEVTNLTTHYGSRQILNGISLTVNKGEVMVIMGGSGSGKSTLLRHLIGLERPTGGCIKLLGQDIGNMPEHEMTKFYRKVGVAFQGGAAVQCDSGHGACFCAHAEVDLPAFEF